MVLAGCDLGISSAKVIVVENQRVIATEINEYKCLPQPAADEAFHRAIDKAGFKPDSVEYCVATGFGKEAVPCANESAPETACLSRAVQELDIGIRTVIDAGAGSFTAYALNDAGVIVDATLHDRCAAGTGLYIDLMCRALRMPCKELVTGAMGSQKPVRISSQCAILAESDVISALNEGENQYDIFAGVVDSVARKISALARQVRVVEKVLLIGGISHLTMVTRELERRLGVPLVNPGVDTQAFAAYGAALIAGDRVSNASESEAN